MLRPDLAPLDAYLGDAASLSASDFLARYPWPVLVVPEPTEDVRGKMRRPETVIHEASSVAPTLEVDLRVLSGASLDALALLARPKRGLASNRVSIGRSPDADVVLLDESVSRFHAELSWGADKDRCVLTDLGAKNGTFMDGVRLTSHVRVELYSGAVITFGSVKARFYAPSAFLSWLSAGAPRSGASPGEWPERA